MVTMSQKEFQRVKVIENAVGGRVGVGEAARTSRQRVSLALVFKGVIPKPKMVVFVVLQG
jgi:hypothetical protein